MSRSRFIECSTLSKSHRTAPAHDGSSVPRWLAFLPHSVRAVVPLSGKARRRVRFCLLLLRLQLLGLPAVVLDYRGLKVVMVPPVFDEVMVSRLPALS